jgi:hypothetical protein
MRATVAADLVNVNPSDAITVMKVTDEGLERRERIVLRHEDTCRSTAMKGQGRLSGISTASMLSKRRRILHENLSTFDEEPCDRDEALGMPGDGLLWICGGEERPGKALATRRAG